MICACERLCTAYPFESGEVTACIFYDFVDLLCHLKITNVTGSAKREHFTQKLKYELLT